MKKKKESSILLPADKYWSDKLDIDFEIELARYRFLCGSMLDEGNQSLNGHYYTTYKDWKAYIEEKILYLDDSELTEFYHYLRNGKRMAHIRNNISSNFLIPILITICFPYLFELVKAISDYTQSTKIIFPIAIILILIWIYILYRIIKNVAATAQEYKMDEFKKYFYSDLKEIVEVHMKENG